MRLDVVYSAPCEPARSTAIAICNECGATFKELADFCNLNHGLWQGLQLDDVRRKYPKVFKQWQESPETVCLPEGETVAEVHRANRAGPPQVLEAKAERRYRRLRTAGHADRLRPSRLPARIAQRHRLLPARTTDRILASLGG